MLFTDEVTNLSTLAQKLEECNIHKDNIKVSVIGFIFTKEGKVIMNRRGPGARDEIGKIQALGGAVNSQDVDFRSALEREIAEEGGPEATVEITDFIGAQYAKKFDNNSQEWVNWIILAYKVNLISGNLINNEAYLADELVEEYLPNYSAADLSETARIFIEYMLENKLA